MHCQCPEMDAARLILNTALKASETIATCLVDVASVFRILVLELELDTSFAQDINNHMRAF